MNSRLKMQNARRGRLLACGLLNCAILIFPGALAATTLGPDRGPVELDADAEVRSEAGGDLVAGEADLHGRVDRVGLGQAPAGDAVERRGQLLHRGLGLALDRLGLGL